MDYTRIKNDINGNPRYAIHMTDLLTADQLQQNPTIQYGIALANSRQWGGKRYRGNTMGGMIVFSTYNLKELIKEIEEFTGADKVKFDIQKIFLIVSNEDITFTPTAFNKLPDAEDFLNEYPASNLEIKETFIHKRIRK